MSDLWLIVVLIIVELMLASANLVLGFLSHFSTNQSEPKPITSGSNLTLAFGSIGIFVIWLGLSYFNSRFLGFYALLFFYGLMALPRDKAKYNYGATFLNLWVYLELLIHYQPAMTENWGKAIGIIVIVFLLSLVTSFLGFLLSSISIFGFIGAFANRQLDTDNSTETPQLGFFVKASLGAFLAIATSVSVGVSLLQANLLGVPLAIILWISVNFTLAIALTFLLQKVRDLARKKMPQNFAEIATTTLAWGGLCGGYLLASERLYVERPWFLFWMTMSIVIPVILATIWQLFPQRS
ncbi:MAG: hypothetical protein SAJ12_17625 [Jaaginema sp. PMC 1079.18]|nr:hypothetical protein [Jaaginema sp. PMC 1080.18]MEC4852802.1 hypothetical protein [Jaaginema sp. PMC 1079.18]MEC4864539.1 hypothetical protein [Jaaginema sp. PMC 1078.18]